MHHKRRRGTVIVDTPNGILVTSSNGHMYLLPGGGAKQKESRKEAALRELKEETNLEATKCKYLFDYESKTNYHKVFLVKCSGVAEPKNEVKYLKYYVDDNIKTSYGTKKIIEKYQQMKKSF
jgi:8-oxo-dGTP pyrophosphatase MutT (NUDIX family)